MPGPSAAEDSLQKNHAVDDSQLRQHPGMLDQSYDHLYPYYVKFCATTRFHPYKEKGIPGSIAGHGLYFLKGVCPDMGKTPTELQLCPESMDFKSSETGVGLSVNKGLKNTNFVVIPGLRLFLSARIFSDESFDFNIKNRIIREVLEKGVFRGVRFHEDMVPDTTLPEDHEEYIARYMFGADYGIAMTRNVYCISLPVNRAIMASFTDYFNLLNEKHRQSQGSAYRGIFRSGRKKDNHYHWNGIFDNCVHPMLNALASLGIIRKKSVNRPLIYQLFNIAVPSNTILDLIDGSNFRPVDPESMFKNKKIRETLMKYDWIPQQSGVLLESVKLAQPNHVFREDNSMFIFPHLLHDRKKYLNDLLASPLYSPAKKGLPGLVPNLKRQRKIYTTALQKIRVIQEKQLRKKKKHKNLFQQTEYAAFVSKLESYLKDKVAWIDHIISSGQDS
ncbi:MAG: hypothetical protein H6618_07675 [Deltaproteobacteria bacterium]|nr:hypothetical protein [Deltaproteobacteria bacterium]